MLCLFPCLWNSSLWYFLCWNYLAEGDKAAGCLILFLSLSVSCICSWVCPYADPECLARGGLVPVFIRKPIKQQKVSHDRPSCETPFVHPLLVFRRSANDGPTLHDRWIALWFSRGSGPVFLRKPIVLRFSRRGVSRPPGPNTRSAHVVFDLLLVHFLVIY